MYKWIKVEGVDAAPSREEEGHEIDLPYDVIYSPCL